MQTIASIGNDGTSNISDRSHVCHRLMRHIFNCFIRFLVNCYILISTPFKDFFASVQRASKRENSNRTPGEGTCYDIGK